MRVTTIAALACVAVLLAACAASPKPTADSLDAVARDYVVLTLEIGEREPGYVDAYYGPAEWAEAAKANPRALPQLAEGAAALTRRLEALPERGLDDQRRQRRAYLLAHVSAASARLRMLQGEKLGFADEAEALFGVRPELRPLSSYDPVLARIEALVPGEGPLAERVAAFRARYVVPKDRLDTVMRAAIAECKARTERHITLPAGETFTLEFVNDKPWSGYNWFKGGAFRCVLRSSTRIAAGNERSIGWVKCVSSPSSLQAWAPWPWPGRRPTPLRRRAAAPLPSA